MLQIVILEVVHDTQILWRFSTASDKIFQIIAVGAAIGAGTVRKEPLSYLGKVRLINF